jgi:hypothetical protein
MIHSDLDQNNQTLFWTPHIVIHLFHFSPILSDILFLILTFYFTSSPEIYRIYNNFGIIYIMLILFYLTIWPFNISFNTVCSNRISILFNMMVQWAIFLQLLVIIYHYEKLGYQIIEELLSAKIMSCISKIRSSSQNYDKTALSKMKQAIA